MSFVPVESDHSEARPASGPGLRLPAFSPRAMIILIAAGLALFALSILLTAYGREPVTASDRVGPGAFSKSALGYTGLYDTLKRLGWPVRRTLRGPAARADEDSLLIVAEPDLDRLGLTGRLKFLEATRLLLVLPKWRGRPDPQRPAWVADVSPVPPTQARDTLDLVAPEVEIVWRPWPITWSVNELGPAPVGSGMAQLMRSADLRPVVASGDGILVGELETDEGLVWILADPDVAANHGLVLGNNATFMIDLVDSLWGWENEDREGAVIFDETVHGFGADAESPLKLLFRFPFAVVTLLAVVAAALWVWAGLGRFGPAEPARPPLDFGKSGLVANGARLLGQAGQQGVILKRYVALVIRSTAAALHAPPGLKEKALVEWLDRLGRGRGVETACADILREVNQLGDDDRRHLPRLFESARAVFHWRSAILRGRKTETRRR